MENMNLCPLTMIRGDWKHCTEFCAWYHPDGCAIKLAMMDLQCISFHLNRIANSYDGDGERPVGPLHVVVESEVTHETTKD